MFGFEYDTILKSCLKRRCDVHASLEQPGLAEVVQNLHALISDCSTTSVQKSVRAAEDEDDSGEDEDGGIACLADMPEIKKLVKSTVADDYKSKRVANFQAYAKRLVHTHVEFCVESESDDAIIQKLKNSAAGKLRGSAEKKTHVGFFYNPNHCGESSSKPHVRPPPLRQNGEHLRHAQSLVLRARDWHLDDGDLWFIFDAGREGSNFFVFAARLSQSNCGFDWSLAQPSVARGGAQSGL